MHHLKKRVTAWAERHPRLYGQRARLYPILAVAVVFAGLGVVLLVHSHASTPAVAQEAESGALAGSAQKVADGSASGGYKVSFSSASGGGGGGGGSVPGAAPGFSKGLDMDDNSGISQDAIDAKALGVTYARVGLECGSTGSFIKMADALKQNGVNFIVNYDFAGDGCDAGISVASFTTKLKSDITTMLPHGVHVWEIGNEENSGWNGESDFCGVNNSGDRACAQKTFEPYLEAAYKTVHSMDPQGVVLYGGIDYDHGNVKPYLQSMLDNGTNPWNFMDAMAYHPYGDDLQENEKAMNDLKSYMEKNATWASKPIWITEVGCWASGFSDQNSPCSPQTEAGKAQQLTGFLNFLKTWNKGTQFEFRGPFCWYIMHEDNGTGYGLESGSGGTKFPAFSAYKDFQLR